MMAKHYQEKNILKSCFTPTEPVCNKINGKSLKTKVPTVLQSSGSQSACREKKTQLTLFHFIYILILKEVFSGKNNWIFSNTSDSLTRVTLIVHVSKLHPLLS